MPQSITLFIGNDNTFFWRDIDQATDQAWITGATVTATLYDASGVAVPDATSVPMTYQTSSGATYVGTIPASALPVGTSPSSEYELQITATYSGHTGYIATPVQIIERTS